MSRSTAFLSSLGWNEAFQKDFEGAKDPAHVPGRVIGQEKIHYHVQLAEHDVVAASITGRLRHEARESTDFPAVGDWVAVTRGLGDQKNLIHRVLKRKSAIQRKKAGRQQIPQLIATNVDFVIIATSLNDDFNLRRIGRYLTLSWESGAVPVLLLTKSDLCADKDGFLKNAKKEFPDVETFAVSSRDPVSMECIQKFFAPGVTSVLLGSSGVGKSTLSNYLLGSEAQKTQELDSGSRGRHTTTARHLLITRWGGLVIDTPGMREISLLDQEEGLQKNFSDIEDLMLRCKFTDCQHQQEPGCAVLGARREGKLTDERWNEYLKLLTEVARYQKMKAVKGRSKR